MTNLVNQGREESSTRKESRTRPSTPQSEKTRYIHFESILVRLVLSWFSYILGNLWVVNGHFLKVLISIYYRCMVWPSIDSKGAIAPGFSFMMLGLLPTWVCACYFASWFVCVLARFSCFVSCVMLAQFSCFVSCVVLAFGSCDVRGVWITFCLDTSHHTYTYTHDFWNKK